MACSNSGGIMHRIALMLGLGLIASSAATSQTSSLKGVELGDLDRKAAPCNDFFAYSNGTWRAQNPIPASMDRWSRRWKAGEENKYQLRDILNDLSSRPGQPKGST